MTNLFTYGTLRKGHGNHRLVEDAEFVGEATIEAIRRGPIQVVPGDGTVHGEIYGVDNSTLRRIDHLEGYDPTANNQAGYVRTTVKAKLEDGEVIEAEVYYFHHRPVEPSR